jgi:hypothetical protein
VLHVRLLVEPIARRRDVLAHVLRVEHARRFAAAKIVDRETDVSRRRDLIGDPLDLGVESVDALEHDDRRPRFLVEPRECAFISPFGASIVTCWLIIAPSHSSPGGVRPAVDRGVYSAACRGIGPLPCR